LSSVLLRPGAMHPHQARRDANPGLLIDPLLSQQLLKLRQRSHTRVEDRIRCGKDPGLGRGPDSSRSTMPGCNSR
jgi:hypothetical protein